MRAKLKRKGQVKQWKVEYYVDPWLTLTGRLLDGSAHSVSRRLPIFKNAVAGKRAAAARAS